MSNRHKANRGKHRKEQKETFLSIFFIITGFIILAITGLFYLFLNPYNSDDWERSPCVLVACNVPNQYLSLYEFVDEEGEIMLFPIWERQDDADKVTFWIRVIDCYNFEWQCSGDMRAVELKSASDSLAENSDTAYTYTASGLASEGIGKGAVFCINYDKNHNSRYSVIKFKHIKKNNFLSASNGIVSIRLPWIAEWLNENHSNGFATSDSDYVNMIIDGERLYFPLVAYTVSMPDMSMIDTTYDLHYISPDANSIGMYFVWSGIMLFRPSLQYKMTNTAVSDFKSNVYAVNIGIALSLIAEGLKRKAVRN